MNQNKVFRANARAQLGGSIFSNNWLMALVVCLIYSGIMGALAATGIGSIATILLGGFFLFGLARVFLQLVRGQKDKVEVSDLFCGSSEFGSLIVLNLLVGLFTSCGLCCSSSPASSSPTPTPWPSTSSTTIPSMTGSSAWTRASAT